MNIFVCNVPEQCRDGHLKTLLRERLQAFGCFAFEVEEFRKGTNARATLPYEPAAYKFLEAHGVPGDARHAKPRLPLTLYGKTLIFKKDRQDADPFVILTLRREDARHRARESHHHGLSKEPSTATTFRVHQLDCGMLVARDDTFSLHSHYRDGRTGSLVLGRRSLAIVLEQNNIFGDKVRMDMDYAIIESASISFVDGPSCTFTLRQAPIFSYILVSQRQHDLSDQLDSLALTGDTSSQRPRALKSRMASLHADHTLVAGSCLVYRVKLMDCAQLQGLKDTLKRLQGGPGCVAWPCSMRLSAVSFDDKMQALSDALRLATDVPYGVRFQLQRLAMNAFLVPDVVILLLRYMPRLSKSYREMALVAALSLVSRRIPFVGPETETTALALTTLLRDIEQTAKAFRYHGSIFDHARKHSHLSLVHRVFVTPTGLYLEGPQLETLNRVLRKYPEHTDNFLRVTFTDEDYRLLASSPDPVQIYQQRFRNVLDGTVNVAGKAFRFLGFSHCSLRERQCWFMAPFVYEGRLVHAQEVIKDLGDFSSIRSPAKCAARIGQAFSDSTDTIKISKEMIFEIPDVERNGRTFTDGCGTISAETLDRVWRELYKTRKKRATLLQIRFQGAKEMLSLLAGLGGEAICLRQSMIKFEGSPDFDLEICGAAYNPLPMYLNRQLICLLEVLGVPEASFLALQDAAVRELRQAARSPLSAARFLELNHITGAQMPMLLRSMNDLKLKFHHDEFLRKVVDLALLAQLREMKHRGRILVPNAHTLYGIADETGVLKPREIYVVTLDGKGKRQVLLGAALITRSPALHPGDVQIVEAVDVPASSALQSLHNCVVFSQHGDRDIPQMLSGGDLDGDLFNVIFEPSLWPKGTYTPADYPRPTAIDIGRQVTAHDLQNFFLLFMQTDNLGMIANAHLQRADQKLLEGPLSEECLVLAGMHSTAVDFAKTGLPVNMKLMPNTYARRCKPDFMAPSARLLIGVENVAFEDIEDGADEMEDAVSALDPDRRPIRYYQSTKTLGTLFRSIDDRQFLTQVMKEDPASVAKPVMSELWDYIKAKALLLQWNHLRSAALEIRDTYNTCLEETAWAFTPDNRQPLSELEVFTGIIVGKDGAIPSKRVRESSIDMKEKFARDVAFVTEMVSITPTDKEQADQRQVLKGDDGQVDAYSDPAYDGNDASESLERSIAAFAVAMEEGPRYVGHMGHLHSFKYIAAGICVRQIEKRFGFLFLRTKG